MRFKKKPIRKARVSAGFSFLGLKGRKAFVASFLVDLFAILTFALVILIFGILYKWTAKATDERLVQFKGTTFSNYLSQVYLRTPVEVGNIEMTMAELLAFYDYNQTRRLLDQMQKQGYTGSMPEFLLSATATDISGGGYIQGVLDPFSMAINSITDQFIQNNFEAFNTCYIFYIKGSGFRYLKHGDVATCVQMFGVSDTVSKMAGFMAGDTATLKHFEAFLGGIPKEYYLTYIPSIDPRRPPMELIVVYDASRLLNVEKKSSVMEGSS